MKINMILFFTSFLVFISGSAIAAPVYKWVDEDGQVHYGSRSKSKNAKKVEIKNRYIEPGNSPAPLSTEERLKKQKRFLNSLDKENEERKEKKREQEEKEAEKISKCNAARSQYGRAERSRAMYNLDEKGNRVYLNEKQFEQALKQARARIQKWCN